MGVVVVLRSLSELTTRKEIKRTYNRILLMYMKHNVGVVCVFALRLP